MPDERTGASTTKPMAEGADSRLDGLGCKLIDRHCEQSQTDSYWLPPSTHDEPLCVGKKEAKRMSLEEAPFMIDRPSVREHLENRKNEMRMFIGTKRHHRYIASCMLADWFRAQSRPNACSKPHLRALAEHPQNELRCIAR